MHKNQHENNQNIKITNYTRTVDSLTRNAIQYDELIVNCLKNCFKDSTGLMLDALLILNSKVWLTSSQDTTYEAMFSKQLQTIENAAGEQQFHYKEKIFREMYKNTKMSILRF